jgi:hypothetical protein
VCARGKEERDRRAQDCAAGVCGGIDPASAGRGSRSIVV